MAFLTFFLTLSLADYDIQQIKVGQYKNLKLKPGIFAYSIGLNYKRIDVTLICDSQVSNLMWTDKKHEYLQDTVFNKCPQNSVVCGSISTCSTEHVLIGACVDQLYLYIKAKKQNTMNVLSKYVQGTCDSVQENIYTTCGAMSYQECDICGDNCRLAECFKSSRSQEPVISICLPTEIQSTEITERCSGYKDIQEGKWKKDCDDSIKFSTVGWGTLVMLAIFMMSFVGFVILVVYHNWKIRVQGQPAFRCLRFCPDILFPKPPERVRETEVGSYLPPEYN